MMTHILYMGNFNFYPLVEGLQSQGVEQNTIGIVLFQLQLFIWTGYRHIFYWCNAFEYCTVKQIYLQVQIK